MASREPARTSGTAAVAAPPAVAPPAPRTGSTGTESAAAAAGTTAAAVPARRVAEQQIEDTLSRFAAAYESLDAEAASRIWPGVDRRALARAFQGLRSQEITFTGCRMAIETVAASVDCNGWTTFVPRIGSQDPRTEQRRWNFQLRKRGETWSITEARIR